MEGRLTRRLTRAWRQLAAAAIAAGAGLGGAVLFAASGAASTFDAVSPQVQVFPVPASASPGSAEMPMISAPDGQGEWFIVNGNGGGTLFEEPVTGGTPSVLTAASSCSAQTPCLTLIAADGAYYTFADNASVVGFTPSGQLKTIPGIAGSFTFDAHDVAVDASGNIYIADAAPNAKGAGGHEIIQALVTQLSGNLWTVPSSFSPPDPQAIALAGGNVWFSTSSGQLGSINPSDTTANYTSAPYPVGVNGNAHTLTAGSDGNLWAVGGGASGTGGNAILKINPANGQVLGTFTAGLPANPSISAITSGPDGNIWFTESGAGAIGQLNIGTGTITNYPLPAGDSLPGAGSDYIAPGPSSTIFFDAQAAGAPAIGEIGGPPPATTTTGTTTAPPPTTTTTTTTTTSTPTTTTPTSKPPVKAGSATISRKVKVSAKGVARVHVSCRGAGVCSGRLTVLLIVHKTVRIHKRKVHKRIATKIGTVRFHLRAGKSINVSIKLSRAGKKALKAARHRRLSVTLRLNPAKGRAKITSVVLVASAAKHAHSRRERRPAHSRRRHARHQTSSSRHRSSRR